MDFTSTPSAAAPTMTWRIPGWAWIAISLAVTAEAAINALRAYGLGQHLEHFTVDVPVYGIPTPVTVSLAGAVLVLAAIAISLAQARAAYVAFRPGALARQRVLAAPVALLLLAVSVTALSLTLLEAQRGKTGDEGGQRTAYDAAKAAYDKADEELRRLEGTRTTAEVRAAMDAAPVSRLVFRRTAECTDMTREDSFEACKPILDLRQEMARAIRKLELEQTLPGLKATLTATPRPAEATWIEDWAASIWSWIMGLAVVAVATEDRQFGIYGGDDWQQSELDDMYDAAFPQLVESNWFGVADAAIDAAAGSGEMSGESVAWLGGGAAAAVAAGGGIWAYSRRKRKETSAAVLEDSRDIDPRDTGRLAKLPMETLEQLAHDAGPITATHFEEVRRHVGTDAAHVYGGLLATLTSWAETAGVAYQGVPVGTIKRHATGKGNANKDAMMAAARARGFSPADDNEADAIAILLWALETRGGVQ